MRYLKGQTVSGKTSPVTFVDAHEGQGATFGNCKIDYMLMTGDWGVIESKIDRDHRQGSIGSDHDSLYGKLRLAGGAAQPPPGPP
eukprot:gene17585-7088_t